MKKDCYLLDLDQNCLGPFTAEEASEKLLLAPFGWLLLRAGFCPIWSEDLEGIELVLKSAQAADFQISPPPPPLVKPTYKPPNAQTSMVAKLNDDLLPDQKASMAQTSSALAKPRTKSLFHSRAEFEVSCTRHFENQKRWFDQKKQDDLGLLPKKEKLQGEQPRLLEHQKMSGVHFRSMKVFFNKVFKAKNSKRPSGALALAILCSVIVFLVYTSVNFAGRITSFSESPYAGLDLVSGSGGSSSSGEESTGTKNSPNEKSLSAKGPAALKQLTRVIEAKLEGNFPAFARELLSLLPHHKIFQDDLIPPPQAAAAFATLFLSGNERENHPSWKPLQRIMGADLQRGVSGQAILLKRLEELAAGVSGVFSMNPMADGVSNTQSASVSEAHDPLLGLESILKARSKSTRTQAVSSDRAVYSPKSTSSDLVYWGARKPGPLLTSKMVHDAFDEFVSLHNQIGRVAGVGRADSALRDYIVTRAQALAAWFVLGFGQPSLTKKIQPAFESQLQNSGDTDSAILALLLNEASYELASLPLRARVEKRFALLRKLHIEGNFFCRPQGSIMGMDFIAQSIRLALLADFPLPQLGQVFTSCLITPVILLPTRSNNFFEEQERLLDIVPLGGNTTAYEWNEFSAALKVKLAALISSGSEVTFSNEWQWYALLSFGSSDEALQRLFAAASSSICKGQADKALDAFCLLVRWRQVSGQQLSQKKELLNQVEARYSIGSAQELAFQWLVRMYLTDTVKARLPEDPMLLGRRYDIERFLARSRPHFNCLEWFAKHGVN